MKTRACVYTAIAVALAATVGTAIAGDDDDGEDEIALDVYGVSADAFLRFAASDGAEPVARTATQYLDER